MDLFNTLNGELSRPGHTTEQIVEAKFFRELSTFEKPLAPRVGLKRFVYARHGRELMG